ncbi:choice-of-anchor P family protein [Jatrophihabitans sp.]|uniref:choice-of-anchor P family protein n=1 Tax=Jatrophihabitans sp. TaxID=1932789 RepID=UPI0030C6CED0
MKKVIAIAATAAVAASVLTGAVGASGATVYSFYASMGGSKVNVLGSTVTSGLTAQSTIQGTKIPQTNSNSLASVKVNGLLTLGAITTSETAKTITGGVEVDATGETAGVNLLGGLVTVDAVKTAVTTTLKGATSTGVGKTTFVGIRVPGVTIPVDVPENFTVSIPGVLSLTLNGVQKTATANGVLVQTYALDLTLLKAHGNSPAGSEILLNPGEVGVANSTKTAPVNMGGFAYGTQIDGTVTGVAKVHSGMTAEEVLPSVGTGGKTLVNSTAAVNAAPVLSLGAIESTATGSTSTTVASAQTTYEIGRLNVLNGLIKADAIKGTATVTRAADGTLLPTAQTTFVNLVIAGTKIPLNVSPNTVINVAGLATITINQQAFLSNTAAVRGIDIKLTVAKYGLPIGAEIEVGAALADIIAT